LSEIRATTISDAAGTGPITLTKQSAAKAWVNFNGTGTIAIRDSFNVSSIDDDGTGDYGVNYSASMGSSNYKITTGATSSAVVCVVRLDTVNAGSIDIRTADSFPTVQDAQQVNLDISGDLA
jgi:hypothetical protein